VRRAQDPDADLGFVRQNGDLFETFFHVVGRKRRVFQEMQAAAHGDHQVEVQPRSAKLNGGSVNGFDLPGIGGDRRKLDADFEIGPPQSVQSLHRPLETARSPEGVVRLRSRAPFYNGNLRTTP
jgi:hypothetical protein